MHANSALYAWRQMSAADWLTGFCKQFYRQVVGNRISTS